MKPFLLFTGSDHYPVGGWSDFSADFATQKLAEEAGKKTLEPRYGNKSADWWHVVDAKTGEQVAYSV